MHAAHGCCCRLLLTCDTAACCLLLPGSDSAAWERCGWDALILCNVLPPTEAHRPNATLAKPPACCSVAACAPCSLALGRTIGLHDRSLLLALSRARARSHACTLSLALCRRHGSAHSATRAQRTHGCGCLALSHAT